MISENRCEHDKTGHTIHDHNFLRISNFKFLFLVYDVVRPVVLSIISIVSPTVLPRFDRSARELIPSYTRIYVVLPSDHCPIGRLWTCLLMAPLLKVEVASHPLPKIQHTIIVVWIV